MDRFDSSRLGKYCALQWHSPRIHLDTQRWLDFQQLGSLEPSNLWISFVNLHFSVAPPFPLIPKPAPRPRIAPFPNFAKIRNPTLRDNAPPFVKCRGQAQVVRYTKADAPQRAARQNQLVDNLLEGILNRT